MRTRTKWMAGGAAAGVGLSGALFLNGLRGGEPEPHAGTSAPAASSGHEAVVSASPPSAVARAAGILCVKVIGELNPGTEGGHDTPLRFYPVLDPHPAEGPLDITATYTRIDQQGNLIG